jgi:hypothetical protein
MRGLEGFPPDGDGMFEEVPWFGEVFILHKARAALSFFENAVDRLSRESEFLG